MSNGYNKVAGPAQLPPVLPKYHFSCSTFISVREKQRSNLNSSYLVSRTAHSNTIYHQ